VLAAIGEPINPTDVQASLLEWTAQSLCNDIQKHCEGVEEIYLCGGGVHNTRLVERIAALSDPIPVASSAALGVDPDWMEALAFAWLARQAVHAAPGNLPAVTGARGPRVLGAIYPC
jgi:anhydro-N-acetylmuramic acid kinase